MLYTLFVLSLSILESVTAAPGLERLPAERESIRGLEDRVPDGATNDLSNLLSNLEQAVSNRNPNQVFDILSNLQPAKSVTNLDEAIKALTDVSKSHPDNLVDYQAGLVSNGIISGTVSDLLAYAQGILAGENGSNNQNPDPPNSVYPKVDDCDAPYSKSEAELRAAIYIPETFTYGQKPPVILFPGTGSTGYTAFQGNFIPLLTNVDWADPVWVNVPGLLMEDVQVNSEYAAYALNYIASLTNQDVAIIAWSQGNINAQWAFKYWPSTRKVTKDHVAISADYKGTVLANLVNVTPLIRTPSVVQQEATSNLIKTLRDNGGDSAYVPTTSVYSGFIDEIVQPQSGISASAFIADARGVGATNTEPQVVCLGQPGGNLYTHESLLASSLAFALAKDALTHPGPGEVSRLDLTAVCGSYLAPDLGLGDFLLTENAILIAAVALLTYFPKADKELPIMSYTASVCA